MGIIDSASRLFDLLSARDATFTRHLKPGLAKEEILRLVAPAGIRLPEEAMTFYGRFDLPNGYAYHPDQPTFYGIYWLLGLEDAVRELMNSRKDLWAEFFPPERYPTSSGWLPFLQEDANLYVLDTANSDGGRCPVLDFSEYDEPAVEFASLEAMFDTMHCWVQEGVLAIESGHVAGAYTGDKQKVTEIAARFNPGVERWKI